MIKEDWILVEKHFLISQKDGRRPQKEIIIEVVEIRVENHSNEEDSNRKIAKIWYSINTADNKSAVEILWDGDTNATALLLSGNGYWDLRTAGDEITNNATTPTGDVLLSTKNFAVGDNYTIIIEFR